MLKDICACLLPEVLSSGKHTEGEGKKTGGGVEKHVIVNIHHNLEDKVKFSFKTYSK